MSTVAFTNQKGGVGKTSLCLHLGGALADMGFVVLLVDFDPQASLTDNLLGEEAARTLPAEETVAAIAAGREADPARLIAWCDDAGVWLAPGSPGLAEFNLASPFLGPQNFVCEQCGWSRPNPRPDSARQGLRYFLAEAEAERHYDYCLIDCPPNLQLCSAMALAASDFYCPPVQARLFAAKGLPPVRRHAEDSREFDNPYLKHAGIIINQRRKKTGAFDILEEAIRAEFPGEVFETVVPDRVSYEEALGRRLPITRHDPKSDPAEVMRALAAEFVARTGGKVA